MTMRAIFHVQVREDVVREDVERDHPTASSISSAKPAALDDCDRVRFLILWQQRTFLAALEVR